MMAPNGPPRTCPDPFAGLDFAEVSLQRRRCKEQDPRSCKTQIKDLGTSNFDVLSWKSACQMSYEDILATVGHRAFFFNLFYCIYLLDIR